jgi:hypothetical protein
MPIRNQNWYNLQATRRYPLDDTSTGEDDTGKTIRDDIIVDCHIRYPSTIGEHLFVQAINITPNLITVLFGLAQTLDDTESPTVATITVDKPAERNVNYSITAFVPGISGWVAFGPGIETPFVGRYSTPKQTLIGNRNARPYQPLPIPTIGKVGLLESLQGIVNLIAESPVTATYHENYVVPKYDPETDQINELPVTAIVFSSDAPTAQFNPLTFFLPPCGQRPENGTCPKPPIERINGVDPDCDTGNIDIVFNDGLTGRPFAECGGLDITTDLGLSAACGPDKNDKKTGKDECPCEEPDAVSNYCWPTAIDDIFDPAACPEEQFSCPALPFCVSLAYEQDALSVTNGSFSVAKTVAPPASCCDVGEPDFSNHEVWVASSAAGLNIALYPACAADWAYDKIISTEFRLKTGGLKQNGGVVLNHMRVQENGRCRTKYYAVIFDGSAAELQLYRFDGALLIKENKVSVPNVVGNWYKISAFATESSGSSTISGTLYDMTTGEIVATLTTNTPDYEMVNGRAGIITNSAITQFNRFEIT